MQEPNANAPAPLHTVAVAPGPRGLPRRGAEDAALTVITLLDLRSPAGAAFFETMQLQQRRLGSDALRWVLITGSSQFGIDQTDLVQLALHERAGGEACFLYLEALRSNPEPSFAERLQVGLQVEQALLNAGPATQPRTATTAGDSNDASPVEEQLQSELTRLRRRDAPDPVVLSINGIHVLGSPTSKQLDELMVQELATTQALQRSGVASPQLFAERVLKNASRFIHITPPGTPNLNIPTPTPGSAL